MTATFTACTPNRKCTAWDIWGVQQQLAQTTNDPNLTIKTIHHIEICSVCGGWACEHQLSPPLFPIRFFIKS